MGPGDGDEILLDRHGEAVVEVTFNRPHRHNAFTLAMYDALGDLVQTLRTDAAARVVVFRGAGARAFAAGNDIADLAAMDSGARIVAHEDRVQRLLRSVLELPQVSVAAIDGLCVGAGLAVATHCDLRVCTAAARFGYPIARTLGNVLSRPLLQRCVDVFGESLTREMLLASRLVDAHRAYGVGAVLGAVPTRADLDRDVDALVEGLLGAAPLTLQATKQQLLDVTAAPGDLQEDTRLLERVYGSAGFREGVRAFLAKDKPRFDRVHDEPLPTRHAAGSKDEDADAPHRR